MSNDLTGKIFHTIRPYRVGILAALRFPLRWGGTI